MFFCFCVPCRAVHLVCDSWCFDYDLVGKRQRQRQRRHRWLLLCSAATQHFWISSREECMLLEANDTFEQERKMLLWLSNWCTACALRIQVHQIGFAHSIYRLLSLSLSRSIALFFSYSFHRRSFHSFCSFQSKCVPLVWTLACAIRAHNCYLRCFTNLNCFGLLCWTSRLRTKSRAEKNADCTCTQTHTYIFIRQIYRNANGKTVFGRFSNSLRQMCIASSRSGCTFL